MFGPWFNQVMRYRLGVGKPMEGYGGFNQNTGVVPPHMGGGATLPLENPMYPTQTKFPGATLPQENPWEPAGGAGLPTENPMKPQKVGGYPGMQKNPWQRY